MRHLNLSYNSLSGNDLFSLATLLKLQNLDISNQLGDAGVRHETNLEPITFLKELCQLYLSNLCSYKSCINITPLASVSSLEFLDISCNYIRNLTPLTNLTNLRHLNIKINHIVKLSPISGLKQLRFLNASHNLIRDKTPLFNLISLYPDQVDLSNNPIEENQSANQTTVYLDLSYKIIIGTFAQPISNAMLHEAFQELVNENVTSISLNVSHNYIEYINWLPYSWYWRIRVLDLSYNWLGNNLYEKLPLTNLEYLNMSHNGKLKNLSFLKSFKKLHHLDISHTGVRDPEDLEHLKSLKSITYLDISNNMYISDISPLGSFTHLIQLDISHNIVRDLNPLTSLKYIQQLDASYNLINDTFPLANMKSLQKLDLSDNPINGSFQEKTQHVDRSQSGLTCCSSICLVIIACSL
jgi:internalin A